MRRTWHTNGTKTDANTAANQKIDEAIVYAKKILAMLETNRAREGKDWGHHEDAVETLRQLKGMHGLPEE